ncbi:chitin synthase-domain-containing protein [Melampsora americana]|nr:chitin synthase-domain-containing protein [Melampsora americana]
MTSNNSDPISLHNLTQILPTRNATQSILSIPSEDSILSILNTRYRSDIHDIYIGQATLLHINPLGPTTDQNDQSARSYLITDSSSTSNPPHLYDLASRAFYTMRRSGKTQAIVYSGLSGSGKTTSMSLISNQLIRLTDPLGSNSPSGNARPADRLQRQLPHFFHLLSSFTQAKTYQNPTASRISTMFEIHFDDLGQLAGAKALVFGLDKTRLRNPLRSSQDRAFDVFYQLIAGFSPNDHPDLIHLMPQPSQYELLASSGCYRLTDRPDADQIAFEDLRAAFKALGFKPKHIQAIFKLLSAILLLGNLDFDLHDSRDFQDQSCFVTDAETLALVAELLGVTPDDLTRILTNRVQYIRKETVTVFLRPDGARRQRDDFMNALYGILLAYVIETANHKMFPGDEMIQEIQSQGGSSIIQLDIPGLQGRTDQLDTAEKRKSVNRNSTLLGQANSFGASGYEEFCINYQTELVQTWLNKMNFRDDQAKAVADGVALPKVELADLASSRLEMLRGGSLGGKADGKPGGIIGGLTKTAHSHRKGKYLTIEEADNDVLDGMRSHFASHSSFISRPNHSTSQSVFGIQHWSGPVSYDITGFVDSDLALVDVEFVSLLRNSEDSFISRLLSGPSLALDRHPLDQSVIVGAQVSSSPLRRPSPIIPTYPHIDANDTQGGSQVAFDSTSPLIDHTTVHSTCSQINATVSQLVSHFNQCQLWHVLCIKPNDDLYANHWEAARVHTQLHSFNVAELVARKRVEYLIDFDPSLFSMRFKLVGNELSDIRSYLSGEPFGWTEGDEYAIGRSRIWLTYNAFKALEDRLSIEEGGDGGNASERRRRSIAGHLAEVSIPDYGARRAGSSGDAWGDLGYHQTSGSREDLLNKNGAYDTNANIPQSPGYLDTKMRDLPFDAPGEARQSVWASEFQDKQNARGDANEKDPRYTDMGLAKDSAAGTVLDHDKAQTLEEVESSKTRRIWVKLVWLLTFWIPTFMLSKVGRMKRPDVQMAWREKVALCIIIGLMCGSVLFVILGLGKVLCPNLAKAWNLTELGYHAQEDDYFVGVRGAVYDMTKFWRGQHSDILAQQTTNSDMLSLAGQDLSNYFPPPLRLACPTIQSDLVTLQYSNWTAAVPNAVHTSGASQVVKSSKLANDRWYPDRFLPFMTPFYKGPIVYSKKTIAGLSENRSIAIYDGGVYDLTDYLYTYGLQNQNAQFLYLDKSITDLIQQQPGNDITKEVDKLPLNITEKSATLACMKNVFYLGDTDFREGPRCTVGNYILLAFTIVIALAVVAKFVAALQLGTKRMPELRDKFVICQVPCYTEGEESLKKTIDSLATLKYDDKRKLIFVICDGMIIGSGNDRPTPRIVLDLLGVDPSIDPDPLLFQSVSEGSKQLNYGKVYSGLYEVDGHVVPYVVVAKVGKPSERSKPGNRGKRDSQIMLMRFLNRVHFDSPMCPLELEICHQIKNVIGVEPQLYEFLFTIDADTEVYPDSLNRLVSAASDDGRIIGICGETKLSNEKVSWWTMIQVYEYYISHHLAKAFESLFGSVTCLPGCFTLYRIRSADKGRPLVVSNLIIDEYAEIHVDTLHKKNLFSLGEDRFFTTLLMKHFPHYKTKFVSDATAMTAAPETWAVLLSQRRRWINSTIHNLGELMFLKDMCGFCCFSMRFFVFLDLVGTIVLPATTVYIVYLIVIVSTKQAAVPVISLIIIGAVYGLQAVIFLLKREWGLIFWLIIYLLAYPIYSFFLPIYSFWNFDDFSWGNTRVVVGEGKHKKVLADQEDVAFDPSMIPLRKFGDYQAAMWEEESKSNFGARRPESVGGFSLASRNHLSHHPGLGSYNAPSIHPSGRLDVQNTGDYYRDGPKSAYHSRLPSRASGLNLRSPSHHGSQVGTPGEFGGGPLPMMMGTGPMSMMGMGGGGPGSIAFGHAPMSFMGPAMGGVGNGSIRGSGMDFMGGAGGQGMMMSGYPSMGGMGDMHARNMSMFSMGGGMMGGGGNMMMMEGGANGMPGVPGSGGVGPPQMNPNPNPSDEEIVQAIRSYLSTQDLMRVTKRSAREAISNWFPNANLGERKAFVNEMIDSILAGN